MLQVTDEVQVKKIGVSFVSLSRLLLRQHSLSLSLSLLPRRSLQPRSRSNPAIALRFCLWLTLKLMEFVDSSSESSSRGSERKRGGSEREERSGSSVGVRALIESIKSWRRVSIDIIDGSQALD